MSPFCVSLLSSACYLSCGTTFTLIANQNKPQLPDPLTGNKATETAIATPSDTLVFLPLPRFKPRNGCDWWRQLMAYKRRGRERWCSDLICSLLQGAISNPSVCPGATMGFCLRGWHERWVAQTKQRHPRVAGMGRPGRVRPGGVSVCACKGSSAHTIQR